MSDCGEMAKLCSHNMVVMAMPALRHRRAKMAFSSDMTNAWQNMFETSDSGTMDEPVSSEAIWKSSIGQLLPKRVVLRT